MNAVRCVAFWPNDAIKAYCRPGGGERMTNLVSPPDNRRPPPATKEDCGGGLYKGSARPAGENG